MNTLSHVYSYSNAGMLDILALLYIVNAYVSNKQYLTDNGAGKSPCPAIAYNHNTLMQGLLCKKAIEFVSNY